MLKNGKYILQYYLEKDMKSKFFVDRKLINKIEKDIKKRNDIEKQISNDLGDFNEQVDENTVLKTFEYIENHGNKNQKNALNGIRKRYERSKLQIDDTLKIVDWYEKMCEFYNNN